MNTKISFCFGIFVFINSLLPIGYAESQNTPIKPFERLIVEINGNRTEWTAIDPLPIVKGDLIILLEGWIFDQKSKQVDRIDLVGFSSRTVKNSLNDQGFVINTAQDLQSRFSIDGQKSIFEIKGFIDGVLVSKSSIQLVDPRLEKVEISLNGVRRTLKDGEKLTIKASDRIAVLNVATNIRGNESVTHELRESKSRQNKEKIPSPKIDAILPNKELIFSRNGQTFGRIPIQWQD